MAPAAAWSYPLQLEESVQEAQPPMPYASPHAAPTAKPIRACFAPREETFAIGAGERVSTAKSRDIVPGPNQGLRLHPLHTQAGITAGKPHTEAPSLRTFQGIYRCFARKVRPAIP